MDQRFDERPAAPAPTRRPRLVADLTLLAIVGVLLIGAIAAGVSTLYRQFYSPTAFVQRYLQTLADGHAADALAIPGVAIDSARLQAADLPASSSEALLREAALAPLTDIRAVSEVPDGDATAVTFAYTAGAHDGTTTFRVQRNGWIGVVPAWRFAQSPLSVLNLTVRGSSQFTVNGFELDKRQVSPDAAEADPLDPLPLLVFAPGLYRVSVDTAISSTPGAAILVDKTLADVPVDLQAEPTEEFVALVQERVDEFLAACTTQHVLQPTGCPFGYPIDDRIEGEPVWSIAQQPVIQVEPDGAGWAIPGAKATAHLEVDVVSLFDGTVTHLSEDVPFVVSGKIAVLPDGTASIRISAP